MSERLATVMVVDVGGRGHALAEKYAESPHVGRVIVIPGNDYMRRSLSGKIDTYPWFHGKRLSTTNIPEILEICDLEEVTLVDVAQENAVAAGLVNKVRGRGRLAVGPTRAAGEIEWSKMFERQMGDMVGMPHPYWEYFLTESSGLDFMDRQPE